jgi:hypothetical protein
MYGATKALLSQFAACLAAFGLAVRSRTEVSNVVKCPSAGCLSAETVARGERLQGGDRATRDMHL